ncbi:hypothetical protein PV326_011131, partial [Microctonus aethiopoides]
MRKKVEYTMDFPTQRKTKMKIVPVTKLNSPIQNSKLYWSNVIDNIESQVRKVRHPSPILFPSSSIASAKRSARDDHNLNDPNTQMRNIARELIVRVSPPSPLCNKRVSDITSHDRRQNENINYLKDFDIDNFEVDSSHEEQFSGDIAVNEENDGNTIDEMKNSCKMNNANVDFRLLNKISQLSKISGYVNDFLASTKVRIQSNMVSNEFEIPMTTSKSNANICMSNNLLSVQSWNMSSNKNSSAELLLERKADRLEIKREQCKESQELPGIYMGLQNKNDYSKQNESSGFRRIRAPSIGVASTVPSFGKIRSLKNLDSIEKSPINDTTNDNNSFKDYLQSPTDSLKFPIHKSVLAAKPQNLLHMHITKSCVINSYPTLTEHTVQVKSISRDSFNKNDLKHGKKSIAHVIKILKRMKRRQALEKKQDNGIFRSSNPEGPSMNTASSSTSHQSIGQRMINIHFGSGKEKTNLFDFNFTNNMKVNSEDKLVQTSMNFQSPEIETIPPETEKDKSAIILDTMPQISAMYFRKKLDKCLACLHSSMNKNLENKNKASVYHKNVNLSSPSISQNIIVHNSDIFSEVEAFSETYVISPVEFANNTKSSDIQTVIFAHKQTNDVVPFSAKSVHEGDFISKSAVSSFSHLKLDPGSDKKGIISSKSFISTLSLASERSKTAADQDDSDQAIDEAGGMNEVIVELKTKFLVPCHAPTNLRPTFGHLKALLGKKIRSIQSRLTSLEKITDTGTDEESGESEKLNDGNKIKCSPLELENETNKSFGYPRTRSELQLENEYFGPNNNSNTSYTQSFEALIIANDICSQLNMNTSLLNYDPGKSFRPTSPLISTTKIMEISRKSLVDNHDMIETLHVLASEYMKRFEKKQSINSKSNASNVNKRAYIMKNLLALLIDSRRHVNFRYPFPLSQFYVKQKCPINPRQLRKALPVKSYNLIAPILGIPQWHPKHWSAIKDARKLKSTPRTVTTSIRRRKSQESTKSEFLTDIDLIIHPPSQIGPYLSEASDNSYKRKQLNPYASFFNKPRRKAIIWRSLTERDLEGYDSGATLRNHASKVTDEICSEFCQWLKSLGGFNTTLDEEVLENMFETDFKAEACKTMQVSIKEMPTVPTVIADVRNCPDAGEVEITWKQQLQDLRAEKKAPSLVGFGTTVPQYVKFLPPRNHIENHWLQSKGVPKNLETMDTIWKDITHLDSVKGFTKWLKSHSNV